MAITSVSYPRAKVWTRDPVIIGFNIFLPAAGDMMQLQVFDSSNSLIVDLKKPLGTATANVSFDLSPVVDAKAKFQAKPSYLSGTGIANVEQLADVPKIYTKYKQASGLFWATGTTFQLFKGGVSSMNFTDDLAINSAATSSADWYPTPTKFLTWLPNQKLMSTDELSWLTYMSDVAASNQQVQYTAYFTDGTQQIVTRTIGTGTGSYDGLMFYIPAGLPQIGFSAVGKTVSYWTVIVLINNLPASQKMTFYADYRPSYSLITLYYRNSLGGWDNFRFKGEYTSSVKAERKEFSQLTAYAGNGPNNWYDTQTRVSWKANTGYVTRDLLHALEDAFASTECAILVGGKWLPVRVTSDEFKYKDTQSGLYAEVLEFETAGTFSNFPKQLRQLL